MAISAMCFVFLEDVQNALYFLAVYKLNINFGDGFDNHLLSNSPLPSILQLPIKRWFKSEIFFPSQIKGNHLNINKELDIDTEIILNSTFDALPTSSLWSVTVFFSASYEPFCIF
jgi:hypothetical protein